jgi:hypothetical protein
LNSQQAKEILLLYRPGVDDAGDPEIAEALRAIKADPELDKWFKEQCTWQTAMRSRFKQISVPEGLREQILSERKAFTFSFPRLIRWAAPVAACAAILLAGLAYLNFRPSTMDRLASFRGRMSRIASREYPRMDLETSDLDKIHQFLLQNKLPDYALPAKLQKATGTGCAILNWRDPAGQERKVAMICFNSGRTAQPGALVTAPGAADLFLFIVDSAAVPNAPSAETPATVDTSGLATATWRANGKTYLLAGDGTGEFLKNYY